jgi:hypothetical protein
MLSAFLTYLNTSTLALALFVAFALLNTIHGKEPETRESAHARDAEPELAWSLRYLTPGTARNSKSQSIAKDFRNKVAPNR